MHVRMNDVLGMQLRVGIKAGERGAVGIGARATSWGTSLPSAAKSAWMDFEAVENTLRARLGSIKETSAIGTEDGAQPALR
jgi:hypothetical protein